MTPDDVHALFDAIDKDLISRVEQAEKRLIDAGTDVVSQAFSQGMLTSLMNARLIVERNRRAIK